MMSCGGHKLTLQTHPDGTTMVRVGTEEPQSIPPSPPDPPYSLPGLAPQTTLRIESLGVGDTIVLGGAENVSVNAVIRTGAGNNGVYLQQFVYDPPGTHSDGHITATIDFDPALGTSLGSGNLLWLGTNGNGLKTSATLARAPETSSHQIIVDSVIVSNGGGSGQAPATLIVADAATIGELEIHAEAEVSVEAPLTVSSSFWTTGKVIADGVIEFTGTSDPSTIHSFDVTGSLTSSIGEVNILSASDVTVLTSSRMGALNIPGTGKLTLQERDASPTVADARVLALGSLFMGNDPDDPDGVLDLKDNAMIIDYDSTTPFDDIREMIKSAYASAAWTGNGLGSSTAAAMASEDHKTAIGYAESDDVFSSFPAEWEENTIDNTMVLIKYTYYGDSNLDGAVNLVDFNRVAGNFGTGEVWYDGDFDFNGNVNLADFNRLAANFGQDGLGDGEGDFTGYTYEELYDMLMNYGS